MTVPIVAIIDDDEPLCLSLADLMRSMGYRVTYFPSAEAFLVCERSASSCIIADIHMPGMGGLNLIRKLREKGVMTPVILITALADRYLDEEANSIGAFCLLRKPFEPNSLLNQVESSLISYSLKN
jgi:FixJ family two-component response regulator